MNTFDLSGTWTCAAAGQEKPLPLPGTLDQAGIGFPDDPSRQWKAEDVARMGFWREGDPIVTRLTRKCSFEGEARISRSLSWDLPEGRRIFVDVERARGLRLFVNGREAPAFRPGGFSSPRCFEITGLASGRDEFLFLSDNSCPGWPRDAIVYSSAASDETQTNWNGLLGTLRLRWEEETFLSGLRVYPEGAFLRIKLETDSLRPCPARVRFSSEALEEEAALPLELPRGRGEFTFRLKLREGLPHWDLEDGNLFSLSASLPGSRPLSVRFGLRSFSREAGHLVLNGRRVFLRCETNCAVFPETGFCPMDPESWREILLRYRSYGVNCVRFHSHCPPEAAFTAADGLGMLMQPELSCWDPVHAFDSPEARAFYREELLGLLRHLACHPSFVMLSFGNELQPGEGGRAFMDELLEEARAFDPTRLYAASSNLCYGEQGPDPRGDFFTAARCRDLEMRAANDGMQGWLNNEAPNTRHDYSAAAGAVLAECGLPLFSFEVGQYEILPDFAQLEGWTGVTAPENLRHIRRKVRKKGLEADWPRSVEATGESSLLCYRAEAEAAMRTEGYSGISLLGLQDFPGQGTALVGMMDARLRPKPFPFAAPERFSAFFRDVLPLLLLEKFTFTSGETVSARALLFNYGKQSLSGAAEWALSGGGFRAGGRLPAAEAPAGGLTPLGEISVSTAGIDAPLELSLEIRFCGHKNGYTLWVYPDAEPACPESVHECRRFDGEALRVLQGRGTVYLSPDSTPQSLPRSVQAQFSPDFWSVCTFPHQAGTMGQLIDAAHPLFRRFPTKTYSTWQWWPMANRRAFLLPERIGAIITEMDSCTLLRPMAKLFECRCGGGRLLVSSLGLHQLLQYPEARALQRAVYAYLASGDFRPQQELSPEWIRGLFEP